MGVFVRRRGEGTSEEVNEGGRLVLLDDCFNKGVSYELRSYLSTEDGYLYVIEDLVSNRVGSRGF